MLLGTYLTGADSSFWAIHTRARLHSRFSPRASQRRSYSPDSPQTATRCRGMGRDCSGCGAGNSPHSPLSMWLCNGLQPRTEVRSRSRAWGGGWCPTECCSSDRRVAPGPPGPMARNRSADFVGGPSGNFEASQTDHEADARPSRVSPAPPRIFVQQSLHGASAHYGTGLKSAQAFITRVAHRQ